MTDIQHIIQFLNKQGHAISIEYNNVKKQIPNVTKDRFLYTKSHILSESDSIELFLKNLPNHGFYDGTIVYFYAPNGSGKRKVGKPVTLNFDNSRKMQTSQQYPITQQSTNYGMASPPGVLNYVHPAQSKLEALDDKYTDLKVRHDELKTDFLDMKSELRVTKEELALKKLELATIESKHELNIQLLEAGKKGMMDSEGFKKLMEQLPKVLPALLKKPGVATTTSSVPAGMSMPNNTSEVKQMFIEMVLHPKFQDQDAESLHII
ncbi:hypothetical protein [Kordia sp.]|uniref:hypothetical protein n=1 Tax=Kordia sp. TaxID=1965332 RepID=UPI0025C28E0C|nr:hypothetical protein [Kordia sp.]MCH2194395.1 hypothetical protein [Kordia sp.]